MGVEPQNADGVRHQPLPVPALDQLTQPQLGDRGGIERLSIAVRTQDPKPPHVPLKLSLLIDKQPLDRCALPPMQDTTVLPPTEERSNSDQSPPRASASTSSCNRRVPSHA